MKDQDDRIRAVFGLTRDDLLPKVDKTSLQASYKYLAANMIFPFVAVWARKAGFREVPENVTIQAIDGFDDAPWIDDEFGILRKATIGRRGHELPLAKLDQVKGKPNQQLVSDYNYWFWNHQ